MFFTNFSDKFKKVVKEEAEKNPEILNKTENNVQEEYNDEPIEEDNNYEEVNQYEEVQTADRATILDNLVQEDKEFSEAAFKAKADNIFIQLYTAVMKQDLQRVKHFLSDDVYAKYEQKINQIKERNEIQIYDELNVSDTNIVNVVETDEEFKLYINLLTKYLDYVISKDTRAFLRGNKDVRTERRINLVFTKPKRAKELKAARTCPNCGANLDLNKTGVCAYCGSVFKLKDYDWVLTEIND